MRRMIIQGLLACLLALFPGGLVAQTLTGYEFWFDDDFAGRKTFTTSGSYREIRLSADTYFMPVGVHKISFRVRQSDGYYSAVWRFPVRSSSSASVLRLQRWNTGLTTTLTSVRAASSATHRKNSSYRLTCAATRFILRASINSRCV